MSVQQELLKPFWQQRLNRASAYRYLQAVFLTVIALLLSAALWSIIAETPFLFFIGAVVLSAWRSGLGPGMLSAALSIVLSDYFLLPPLYTFFTTERDILQFTIFALVAFLISSLEESRTRSETALRAVKEQLEVVLNGVADGITAQDESGRVMFANQAAAELTGRSSPAEMVGTLASHLPRRFELLAEDGQPVPDASLPRKRAFAEKKPIQAVFRLNFKESQEERWISIRTSPVMTDAKKVDLVVSVFRDITDVRRIETLRRETQNRLRNVLDNLAAFVIVLSPEGHVLEANRAALDIAQLELAAVLHKPLSETYWWSSSPQAQAKIREAIACAAAGERVRYDAAMRFAENQFLQVDFIIAPVLDADGKLQYLVASGIDVTERTQLTTQLVYQRKRFETILNSVPGIVYESSDGADAGERRMDFISNYAETMLGYPVERWRQTRNFWREVIHPDDWEHAVAGINKIFNTGESDTVEFRCVHQSGEIIHVEARSSVIYDPFGKPTGTCGVVLDVSERKKRTLEIMQLSNENAEQRNQLNSLMANVPGIVYDSIIDPITGTQETIYISDYAETMLGYPAANWRNVPNYWSKIIHPEDQEDIGKTILAVYESGKPGKVEFRCIHADGSILSVEAHFAFQHEGDKIRSYSVIMDITDRKHIEEELKQNTEDLRRSNQDLEHFAYVASHDLQEPLRMVTSFLQLIEKHYGDKLDKDATEFIAFAVDGATRMKTLINDLLAYSRVQRSQEAFETVDLNTVLNRVKQNLHFTIVDNQAIIEIEPLPKVIASEGQMVQLFQNLIGNAIKFRREAPPHIRIGAIREKKGWRFTIQDNGIGIEKEYTDRIFIIFQRLHNRTEYPGTGIGLAICKQIVERHGGEIGLESELGVGTTFYFTLPMTQRKRGIFS